MAKPQTNTSANISTTHSLPIALLRARESVMGPIRKMLSDAGVTEQQWRVLRVLEEEGPMDPTTIASRAVLMLPSLTRILQKLEDKGLITRRRDENDGRRYVIAVTEAGSAVIYENMEMSQKIMADLKARIGDKRHALLIELLTDLTDLDF